MGTAADIIESLGGYVRVAQALGMHRTTIFRWCKRGIPPSRASRMADLARECGRHSIRVNHILTAKGDPGWKARG